MHTDVVYTPEAIIVFTPDMLYDSGHTWEARIQYCPLSKDWLIEEKEVTLKNSIFR